MKVPNWVQEEVDLIMVLVVKVQIAILTLQAIMHNNRQKRDILLVVIRIVVLVNRQIVVLE